MDKILEEFVLGVKADTASFELPSKTFTKVEWEEMTKDDAVLEFIARVNASASAKPY